MGIRRFGSVSGCLRSFCDASWLSRRRTEVSRNADESRALATRCPLGDVGRDPDAGDPCRGPRPGDAGREDDPGRCGETPGRAWKGLEPLDLRMPLTSASGAVLVLVLVLASVASWEPLHSGTQDRPDDNSGSARAMLDAVVVEAPSLAGVSACFSRRISRPKRFRSPIFMPRATTT